MNADAAAPADWRPGAGPEQLRARARCLGAIRAYFAASGAMEVTTPVLTASPSCEPTLSSLRLQRDVGAGFLRTSPEAALKRLLAAGHGDIYEIGPAFRDDESGRLHAAEFTMLEWYRVGYNHHQLMDDVAALLAHLGYATPITKLAYADLFEAVFGATLASLDTAALAQIAARFPMTLSTADRADRSLLLDSLYAHEIEPELSRRGAVFVYDFPCEQRAYAQLVSTATGPAAARFELVINGVEIANGYHEITDPREQRACFAAEAGLRRARGLAPVTPDPLWLAALEAGMPAAAGVALGVERLLMVLAGEHSIDTAMAFRAR